MSQEKSVTDEPKRGSLGTIFLIVMMDLLGWGIIIPLLPIYSLLYNASPLEAGLLLSVYSMCQFIASPILGMASDRYGRRAVLMYSQLGSVAGYILLGVVMQHHWQTASTALGLFYLSRIIDGLSGGNVSTAQAYISDVTSKENRSKGMGVIGAAFGVGFAIGPFIGGVLAGIHLALPGYFAAAASFVAMLMTWWLLPEPPRHQAVETEVWLHPGRFRPIFQNTRLTQLLLIAFFSMCGFTMLESMGSLLVSRPDTFNFTPRGVGLYFGYFGLIIAIVQGGLIGRLSRRFGDWPLAIIGPLLVALGMLNLVYMAFHPILWMLLAGAAIMAGGRSLQTPTIFSLISKNSDPRTQGVVFGFNQGLLSLARVIGPALGGWIYTTHDSGPFALATVILVCVSLWTLTIVRQRRAALAETAVG
jgi:MFS transporter, DHA1 family, tetracycline resistance protein